MDLSIRDLNTYNQMLKAFPLIHQFYPKITEKEFAKELKEMIELSDYKMIASYIDKELVGVSGYLVSRMFYCGKFLQACNLIVLEKYRGQGIGKKLLQNLEEKAKELNCDKLVLDSYTENKKSHSLYFGENFYIRGFHFMKNL